MVSGFDVQPRTTNSSVTASWIVTDNIALNRVELWRTSDLNNAPDADNWIQTDIRNISGTYASGSFNDSPGFGTWWYGLHVVDQAYNMGEEPTPPGPIKIVSDSSVVCVDEDSDSYDNCTSGQAGDDGKPIDCDDNEYWANPGGFETCDTVDNNCSGIADEGCDDDNDTYCDINMPVFRNNTMCPGTYFINGRSGDDCNDANSDINPGKTEVCGNDIDDNCDEQIDENCDTIRPVVTAFDVQPRTTNSSVTASWAVTDNIALNRVELWRTSDLNNAPNADNWIQADTRNIAGLSASGEFINTPDAGTWWYGLHVVDQVGNVGYEPVTPGPIKIIKTGCTPDGCNTNCPNDCSVSEDPDCGCLGGNSCCGIGCNNLTDSDCEAILTVTITNPLDGSKFSQDISIIFQGIASGGTPGYNYSWSSNIDGFLGGGQSITIPK